MRSVVVATAVSCVAIVCLSGFTVPAQTTCEGVSEVAFTDLTKVTIASGLPGQPLFVTTPPDDADRRYIVSQDGRIHMHRRGDGAATWIEVLDISAIVQPVGFSTNELGLLGMAFDPDFANTQEVYLSYTESEGDFLTNRHWSVIARYTMDPVDPDLIDPTSETRILRFEQTETNHNGGWVGFGPDGYLYFASGDGGGAGDQHGTCGHGQDEGVLFGKILRIDPRGIAPSPLPPDCGSLVANYSVPSDNPLVGSGGCDEIWSYGLRNPWRPSFDRETGDLYVADVGQSCWEEINWVPATSSGGENFGWRQMEGTRCFLSGGGCDPANQPCGDSPDCGDPSLTLPVLDYARVSPECSVTGGYSYRGCRMPTLRGTYFYGDYCAGWVRSFEVEGGVATNPLDWAAQLGNSGANSLTSFGEDAEGELYVVERTGAIGKVVPLLSDMQVSGAGAEPFRLDRDGPWTWENLSRTSEHAVVAYRVYKGVPNGVFTCIHRATTASWVGDPDVPASGEVAAYVVTAVDAEGTETRSGDPERQLSAEACP